MLRLLCCVSPPLAVESRAVAAAQPLYGLKRCFEYKKTNSVQTPTSTNNSPLSNAISRRDRSPRQRRRQILQSESTNVRGDNALFQKLNHDDASQETRLSALRPPGEFFDYHRISRPADFNQATTVSSISCNYPKPRDCVSHVGSAAHILQHTVFLWYVVWQKGTKVGY